MVKFNKVNINQRLEIADQGFHNISQILFYYYHYKHTCCKMTYMHY